jgi:hypothetical protein
MAKSIDIQEMRCFEQIHILLTNKCNLACAHCCMNSGPDRKDELPVDTVLKVIAEVGPLRHVKQVVFSGGEPFLYKGLRDVVQAAHKYNKKIAIITNAFWAKDLETAKRKLAPLKLNGLQVSVDQFHQTAGVPYEYTKNAIEAALQLNIDIRPGIIKDENAVDRLRADFGDMFEIKSHHVKTVGRWTAAGDLKNVDNLATRGCNFAKYPHSEMRLAAIALLPNGDLCLCGPAGTCDTPENPFIVGNVQDNTITEIMKTALEDPSLRALTRPNLWQAVSIIRAAGLGDRLKSHYYRVCDLCVHLYQDEEMRAALRDAYAQKDLVYHVDIKLSNGTFRFKVKNVDLLPIARKALRRKKPYNLVELVNQALDSKVTFAADNKADPGKKIFPISLLGDSVFDILDIAYGSLWRTHYAGLNIWDEARRKV